MANELPYSGSADPDHPIRVSLKYRVWPPIQSDQWFLPRFEISLTNMSKVIPRGSVELEIGVLEPGATISDIQAYKREFQRVFHADLVDFQPGSKRVLKFRIESRYLRPGTYFLKTVFQEWIPSDSPIRELNASLAEHELPDETKMLAREHTEKIMKEHGVDPYARPVGSYKIKQLFDYRFQEPIKVHSLATTSTIIGGFIGSTAAAVAAGLYTIARILHSNWNQIYEFFTGAL
tara:strand:- start:49 stop:750 length:702 start_codon:yes stop_codon:yes gene_type:complete